MTDKKFTKFENRITETFLKYGRFPLFVVIGLITFFVASVYLYTNIYQVWRLHKDTAQFLDKVQADIDVLIEETVVLYSNQNQTSIDKYLYQLYYAFNSDYEYNNQYVILDMNREPLFITKPLLIGDQYSKLHLSYILNQVDLNQTALSTINLTGDDLQRYIVFSRNIMDNAGHRYYVLIYFNTLNFQPLVDQQRANHFVITDRFNNIIISTTSEVESSAYKFNPSDSKFVDIRGSKYHVYVKTLYGGLITVHMLVQNSLMFLLVLVLVITALLTFYFLKQINQKMAHKIGKEVSESVNAIVEHVRDIQHGNLGRSVVLNTHDELQFLSEAINEMSTQLDTLMHSNQRLIELKKNAEIRQLEAQFNPHFLFNSLEAMRYLITENPRRAQNMIVNVSKLLRYSISHDQNEILFSEDMKFIDMYLEIHKERLGDRLNYTIDIEPELENVLIPKLIIQPLVENSIKHGFKHKDKLNIGIVAYEHQGFVYIHVIDDGNGMPELLVDVLNNLKCDSRRTDVGYGVSSVIQRINLMYGNDGTVYIESDQYGTYITINFPLGGYHDI